MSDIALKFLKHEDKEIPRQKIYRIPKSYKTLQIIS